MVGLPKVSVRRASFTARGVFAGPGVIPPNAPCAGLGVTLTKSAKLKFCPGVLKRPKVLPGVLSIDDGNWACFDGGVHGANPRKVLEFAGEGEVARKSNKSAPSPSEVLMLRSTLGGVRGGEEWNVGGSRGSSSSRPN